MTLVARPLTRAEQHDYAAVRLHAVHQLMPYLASAVFRLQPWAVDGLGTFGVDAHWRVVIDPVVLDRWGIPAAAGVLLHEVGHALRDHAAQVELLGSDVDRFAWNCCGDAAINDDLVDAGVPLPGEPVLPGHLRDVDGRPMRPGLTALAYYEQLPVAPVGQAMQVGADRAPGTGGLGDLGALTRVAARTVAPAASCGAISGGGAHDVQLPGDAAEVSPAEQRLTRRAVAADVLAAGRGRGRGSAPAGLRRWADDELTPPTVPWQQVLRGAIRSGVAHAAGALTTTYARPSRRRSPGIVLPGTRRPVPTVAVVVDTSASMGEELLHAVLAEVEGIARQVGASGQRLRVLAVDAAVHEVRSVARAADVVLRGGGGTDLTPGLEAAVAARPRPDVVVVCTDGLTPWPATAPGRGTRWIVVLLGDGAWRGEVPPPPPWAAVVTVDVGVPA